MKRNLVAALALAAVAAVGAPGIASASTTAGTTILNVVKVEYKDVTNTNSFSAAFSTTVTVNLVKAGLSITTPPSAANYTPAFSCLATGSYASGGTFSAVYALAATANGQDAYQLALTKAHQNASSSNATYTILNANGTVQVAATSAPSNKILNSAIVVGTKDSDILQFPGGSLAAANGFAAGDIVVVDYGATKTAYLVKTVTLGNAAGYSVGGNAVPSSVTGSETLEKRDEIQVEAWTNNPLGIGNGGTAPNFVVSAPAVGTVVGQMALVRIDVSAVSSVAGTDATVNYQLRATDSAGNNEQFVGTGGSNVCVAGNFLATRLTILKQVKNVTKGGGFAATATSDPDDILEYQVTVTNPGGQAALVKVTDAVPAYTTLVTHSAAYGDEGGGTIFAQVTDGAGNVVNITTTPDSEPQPNASYETGFGEAAGTTATSAIAFFMGDTSEQAKGGTVPFCSNASVLTESDCTSGGGTWVKTYTVLYRVKVD